MSPPARGCGPRWSAWRVRRARRVCPVLDAYRAYPRCAHRAYVAGAPPSSVTTSRCDVPWGVRHSIIRLEHGGSRVHAGRRGSACVRRVRRCQCAIEIVHDRHVGPCRSQERDERTLGNQPLDRARTLSCCALCIGRRGAPKEEGLKAFLFGVHIVIRSSNFTDGLSRSDVARSMAIHLTEQHTYSEIRVDIAKRAPCWTHTKRTPVKDTKPLRCMWLTMHTQCIHGDRWRLELLVGCKDDLQQ
ncbi:hypothetical protein C8Q77DRAFT_209877 [Trametes polyzona]|nr:hypothetical protein C8Q77DRAFT_209877 [Trametes polyzona]